MNTAEMIEQYIQCRDWIEADNKQAEARQEPVRARMASLEAAVTVQINELGGESIKTEKGTAYRTSVLAVKLADRETFMDFVFDGRREGFLTNTVSKEAVKEYLDAHNGQLPPGIDVTTILKTNFRRA